ncbi:MAG: hypothetical protein A3J97_03930 [Spirochaetes bacterium RIFOXYC1_FULL_54_7]|nr:MAG: hypothetical protein A3J97_03930 [Spirochaetes bacterium RIFOXYC1_FULL_54_7]
MKIESFLGKTIVTAIRDAIVQGLAAAEIEMCSNQGYDTGIGRDHRARCRSRLVENALYQMCGVQRNLGLKASDVRSQGVNKLFIQKSGFNMLPVQAPDRRGYLEQPLYQSDYRSSNPSRQLPLFNEVSGHDLPVFFRIEYGVDELGSFASITIPDSNGGLYASLILDLSVAVRNAQVEDEKIPQPKFGRKKELRTNEA